MLVLVFGRYNFQVVKPAFRRLREINCHGRAVGPWGKVSGLLAEQEFKVKIKKGWSRGKKWKASVLSTGKPPSNSGAQLVT